MLNHLLHRFRRDDRGAELVEWAVVTVVLLVATAPLLIALQDQMIDMFRAAFLKVEEDPPDTY